MSISKDVLWAEKYRPATLTDLVLPKSFKAELEGIVRLGTLPNVTFAGSAGVGKTSAAKVLVRALEADVFVVNASLSGNIDTLRTDISQFASAVSMSGKRKVVILDEADHLSRQMQAGLRAFIEETSANVGFILTVNYPNKILPALLSRCPVVKFEWTKDEAQIQIAKYFKRSLDILTAEGVGYNEKTVLALLKKYYPDFRQFLNVLQRHALRNSEIDSGILTDTSFALATDVVPLLKNKDALGIRAWVASHGDLDLNVVFRDLYDALEGLVSVKSIPELVLVIGNYMRDVEKVADPQILLACFLYEMMMTAEWL